MEHVELDSEVDLKPTGRDCPLMRELRAHVVQNVKELWFELCKELLGEHANNKLIIDDITVQYGSPASSEECCINMFEKWLYLEGEDATWDQLLTAVSNIGLPSFANDLQQKLLGNSKLKTDQRKALYYQAKHNLGSENVQLLKLLIFGPPGAGKSSLLKVLLGSNPDVEQNSTGVCDRKLVQCKIAVRTAGSKHESTWTKVELKHEILRLKHKIYEKLDPAAANSAVSQSICNFNQESQNNHLHIENNYFFNNSSEPVEDSSSSAIITDTTSLIACYDCGGQLEFFDVMPALMTIPTGYVMVFDMSKDLQSRKSTHYLDGEKFEHKTNTKTKDLLNTALANVQSCTTSVSNATAVTSRLPTRGKLVVVGTHLDKCGVSDDEKYKKVLQIDKEVADLLPGSIDQFINVKVRDDENIKLVHPISNTAPEGRKDVAQEIRTAIEQMAKKVTEDVPISWLLFQLEVRHIGESKNYVRLEECVEIAKNCYIKEADVNDVIGYFHELGILLNYRDIPELQDVVFCNPQWLFDKLTKLIKLKYKPRFTLIKKGVLNKNNLCELYKEDFAHNDILNYEILLHLFESLNIIAKLPNETDLYFVPAILNPAPLNIDETLPKAYGSSKIHDTLIVKFTKQYLPRGVFCCLIADLMNAKTDLILQCNDNAFKDLLVFQISSDQQYVFLRDKIDSITVEIYCRGNEPLTQPDVVCGILYKALKRVCKNINLKCDFKFGFTCTTCNDFAGIESHFPFPTQTSCEKCQHEEELTDGQVVWFISTNFLIRKGKSLLQQVRLRQCESTDPEEILELQGKLFTRSRSFIVKGLSPNEIVDKLVSHDLVGYHALQKLSMESKCDDDKNRIIVDELSRGKPGTVELFCKILEENDKTEHIGVKLRKDWKKICSTEAKTC